MAAVERCPHVNDGVPAQLVTTIWTTPHELCLACVYALDRQVHLSLVMHGLDPSQLGESELGPEHALPGD